MRRITIFTVAALLTSMTLSEEADTSIPSLDQLNSISFSCSVWFGFFNPDGSARLMVGAIDGFYVPEGSFSFEDIYALLLPHSKRSHIYEEHMGISFHSGDSFQGFYIDDMDTMRTLMYGLRDKIAQMDDEYWGNGKAWLKRFSSYPLVPGDDADGNPIPGYERRLYTASPRPPKKDPPEVKAGQGAGTNIVPVGSDDLGAPSTNSPPAEECPKGGVVPDDNPPAPPVVIARSGATKQSILLIGIGILLGAFAIGYLVRKKSK